MRICSPLQSSLIALSGCFIVAAVSASELQSNSLRVAGLHASVRMLRDIDGVRHIYAKDEHDALFVEGWFQAEDRLFQIDTLRRTASGTLAELVGAGALPSDIQLRTLGLRRAAERSLNALSSQTVAGLQAYSDGVNAWVTAHQLPKEYSLLGITKFLPWSALDSVTVAKAVAFELSFDDDTAPTLLLAQYESRLNPGTPGMGDAVFFQDVYRSAPFAAAVTVPDADASPIGHRAVQPAAAANIAPSTVKLLERYQSATQNISLLQNARARRDRGIGSNEWAVTGARTRDGRALVANDPHLDFTLPAVLYDEHLVIQDGLDAFGSAFPGQPWVVLGQNANISWGETVTGYDVTDYYQEQITTDPNSPSGLATVFRGSNEPIVALPVTFNVNLRDGIADHVVPAKSGGSIPSAILIVPRRNNGPIIQADLQTGSAISVQYTGFSGTRELEAFRRLNRARNLTEFQDSLQYIDVGSVNFIYGDTKGNIGYFATAEVPLREDLQSGSVQGAPPWLVRDGRGGNEWLSLDKPGPTDGTGYQYIPFAELPHVVNPPAGFVVNANNDPIGITSSNDPLGRRRKDHTGIEYLAYTFDFGIRATRITELLQDRLLRGPVDRADMQDIQADVTLLDAKVLTPYIVQAFENAQRRQAPAQLAALARNPGVAEAVARLQRWDFTAPTGVAGGFDAARPNRSILASQNEQRRTASIATTLYSVWRGQALANALDHTLTELKLPLPPSDESIKALLQLLQHDGTGASTLDYFAWVGLPSAADRRDFIVLKSLADALGLLAGPSFAAAFGGSPRQEDYVWGRLHRLSLDSVLGGPFDIPGSTPGFPPTFADLPGFAVDGGMATVDNAPHDARASDADAFMFNHGPNRRYVGAIGHAPGSIEGENILPGGESGVLGDPFYANMLNRYLRNETYPMRLTLAAITSHLDREQILQPPSGRTP